MNDKKLSDPRIVFLLALLCCFLWGSATPSIKTGYEIFGIAGSDTASIIVFAGMRFFLAGAIVLLIQSCAEKRVITPEKGSAKAIITLSLLQTMIQYFCFYVGLAHTSGVSGTIISGAGGLFAILLACVVFRQEKLTANKLIGVIIGFSGIIIMNLDFKGGTAFHFTLLGEGLVLMSQLSYALSSIMVKRYSSRFSVVMLSGYQFMLGGLVMVIVGLLTGGRVDLTVGIAGWALLIYMALISSIAYSVWGLLMANNPVSRIAIFNFLVPLFGVVLSAVFLGETEQALQLNKLIALALVCLGIFTVNKAAEKKD